jgi:hypothetical protein
MAKTPAYTITTTDDTKVDERTEGKAADKLAQKLTAETGLVHRVYTPTGKLRLETEVVEPAPADEVPSVDISEVPEAAPVEAEAEAEVEEVVEAEVEAEEVEEAPETAPVEVREMNIVVPRDFVSYATLMDLLKNDDDAVREDAASEWAFRLEVYKRRTNAKDASKRIVGPAMAAALERGETTDGRTIASLAKRGLVERGEGLAFTVNEAGRAALAAAVAAVTDTE